jgi:hypothetical protein
VEGGEGWRRGVESHRGVLLDWIDRVGNMSSCVVQNLRQRKQNLCCEIPR